MKRISRNRPPVSAKIMRGLEWVASHAEADLDATMTDSVPSLSDVEAAEVRAALNYITALRGWHRGDVK